MKAGHRLKIGSGGVINPWPVLADKARKAGKGQGGEVGRSIHDMCVGLEGKTGDAMRCTTAEGLCVGVVVACEAVALGTAAIVTANPYWRGL